MSSFPPEIWEHCFSYASSHDLQNLVLVNRTFRDICQPKLFERLSIDIPNPRYIERYDNGNEERATLRRKYITLKNMVKKTHFADMVREARYSLGFYGTPEENMRGTKQKLALLYTAIHDMWANNINEFTHLTRLELVRYKLEGWICQKLASLPQLSELSLRDCAIDGRGNMVLRQLKSFDFKHPVQTTQNDIELCEDAPLLLPIDTLDELILRHRILTTFYIESFIRHHFSLNNLRRLHVHLENEPFHSLFRLLETCSVLEQLSVISNLPETFEAALPDKLAPGHLPSLREFGGPACLVPLLVPGRPVHVLSIYHRFLSHPGQEEETILQALCAARQSTRNITKLRVPSMIHPSQVMPAIPEFFPDLEDLYFSAFDCKYDQLEILEDDDDQEQEGDDESEESDESDSSIDDDSGSGSDTYFELTGIDSDWSGSEEPDTEVDSEMDDVREKSYDGIMCVVAEELDVVVDAQGVNGVPPEAHEELSVLEYLAALSQGIVDPNAPLNWLLRFITSTVPLPKKLRHLTIYYCTDFDDEGQTLPNHDDYAIAAEMLRRRYGSLEKFMVADHYGPCYEIRMDSAALCL